jgi:hypothetical protein
VVNWYVVEAVVARKFIVPRPVRVRVMVLTNLQAPPEASPILKIEVVAAKVKVLV